MKMQPLALLLGFFACIIYISPAFARGTSDAHVPTPIDGNSAYHLIFDDEFQAGGLDTTKWTALDGAFSPGGGNPAICMDPAEVTTDNLYGALLHVDTSSHCSGYTTAGVKFRSGVVGTDPSTWKFSYTPGTNTAPYHTYAEARVYFPCATNTVGSENFTSPLTQQDWPGFWDTGQTWPNNGESDIATLYGPNSNQIGTDYISSSGTVTVRAATTCGYHVWGELWTGGSSPRLDYYLDGALMGSVTSGVQTAPHYLVNELNASAGSGGTVVTGVYTKLTYNHVFTDDPTKTAVTPQTNYGGPGDCGGSAAGTHGCVANSQVPTASLSASPSDIQQGSSSTLTWSSTNATTCTGTNFSTSNATSGTLSVSPSSTTTYSMTCTGSGGTSQPAIAKVTVSIPTPTATLSANPTSVQSGSNSTLTWSSTNVSSCTGTNFSTGTGNPTSGTATVTPSATTTYSITCSGSNGNASASATVTVLAPPVTSLTVNPASIASGASSTLKWGATNATSCTGTNFSTGNAVSGQVTVSPTATTTYSVSCSGNGGTTSANATLTVTGTNSCALDTITPWTIAMQAPCAQQIMASNDWGAASLNHSNDSNNAATGTNVAIDMSSTMIAATSSYAVQVRAPSDSTHTVAACQMAIHNDGAPAGQVVEAANVVQLTVGADGKTWTGTMNLSNEKNGPVMFGADCSDTIGSPTVATHWHAKARTIAWITKSSEYAWANPATAPIPTGAHHPDGTAMTLLVNEEWTNLNNIAPCNSGSYPCVPTSTSGYIWYQNLTTGGDYGYAANEHLDNTARNPYTIVTPLLSDGVTNGKGWLQIRTQMDPSYHDPYGFGRDWYTGALASDFKDSGGNTQASTGGWTGQIVPGDYVEIAMLLPDARGANANPWPGMYLLTMSPSGGNIYNGRLEYDWPECSMNFPDRCDGHSHQYAASPNNFGGGGDYSNTPDLGALGRDLGWNVHRFGIYLGSWVNHALTPSGQTWPANLCIYMDDVLLKCENSGALNFPSGTAVDPLSFEVNIASALGIWATSPAPPAGYFDNIIGYVRVYH